MTTEDKVKAIRARIDEVKQFMDKYGVAAGFAYMCGELTGDERTIWLMALVEWMDEHPNTLRLAK